MPTEEELNALLNGTPAPEPEIQDPEPEAEPEAAEEPEETPQVEEPEDGADPTVEAARSRREVRLDKLANEKKLAEAEAQFARENAERYRREAEEARRNAEALRQRDYEANLDPQELRMQQLERLARDSHMASLDAADRSAFASTFVTEPWRSAYADKVEAEVQKARANGQMPSREAVLTFLLGQEYRTQLAKSQKARKESVETVRAQRGKGTTPKSDASGSKKTEAQRREERLANLNI